MARSITGVFPLWKPKGMTSFTAVKKTREIFGTKKAGHTGTLDPEVEGVLPICLGKATKIAQYLTAGQKVYKGEVTLGFSTTTEDASGETVKTKPVPDNLNDDEIQQVFYSLEGEISQTPPMYSAVKVKGKKLYEYAREGKVIERPSRLVNIYKLELLTAPVHNNEAQTVSFEFRAVCSKGTYIRTLAVEIGNRLGFPAHMSCLVREASGAFRHEDCFTLEDLQRASEKGDSSALLTSIENALTGFPVIQVDDSTALKVLQGAILPAPEKADQTTSPIWALYNEQGECLALYKKDEKRSGKMKPEKMIRTVHDTL